MNNTGSQKIRQCTTVSKFQTYNQFVFSSLWRKPQSGNLESFLGSRFRENDN